MMHKPLLERIISVDDLPKLPSDNNAELLPTVQLSRRNFFKISLSLTGSLFVGFSLLDDTPAVAQTSSTLAKNTTNKPWEPNAWIRLDTNGQLTFIIDKSEMGQGVSTALAMLIAEELEVELSQIRWEFAPLHTPNQSSLFDTQITLGSSSVRTMWEPLRQAGATVRLLLITAAAKEWSVPIEECVAIQGMVKHASGKQKRYGELLASVAQLPIPSSVPSAPPLKTTAQYRLIGKPQRRLDTLDKVKGSARFGIDVQFKGLLTAVIIRPPVWGAKLKSIDASGVKVPGVKTVVEMEAAVAIVATNYHSAQKARAQLKVEWDTSSAFTGHSQYIATEQAEIAATQPSHNSNVTARRGNSEVARTKATTTLDAVYKLPFLAHACMEPMNCTAWVQAEGEETSCEVWVPTQYQSGVAQLAKEISGASLEKVKVHNTYLGGGYGRRLALDFVRYAVDLSSRLQKPVKVIYSREDDFQAGYYRPSSCIQLSAGLDAKGQLLFLDGQAVAPVLTEDLASEAEDPFGNTGTLSKHIERWALAGLEDTPYEVAHQTITWLKNVVPIPMGLWPSGGYAQNVFARECFIDELAEAAAQSPLVFRRKLLQEQPKRLAVLDLLVEKSGRDDWLTDSSHKKANAGLAIHTAAGTTIAMMAEVNLQKDQIRVPRIVCAVDCGQIINPATLIAQIESAIVFALSATLYQRISFSDGAVQQKNFSHYPMLRFSDMPKIEVYTMESQSPPGGISELPVPLVAPAVANALFALTGKRYRNLPLQKV